MKKIYALFMTLCLIISATAAPVVGTAKKSYPLYQPEVVKTELAPSMHKAPAATQGLQYDAEAGELIRYYNETDQIAIDADYLSQGNLYIDIMAGDYSDYLSLLLFVEDTVEGAIIPEGTYPITSEPAYNTALASQGYDATQGVIPCAYYPLVVQAGQLYISTPMYFMQSGNIVVEHVNGTPKITINAVNSNNVPMTIVYEVGGKSEKVEVKAPLKYDATEADGALDYTYGEDAVVETTDKGFYGMLDVADATSMLALLFVYPEGTADAETTIPAGTYTISDSQEPGTVLASSGVSNTGSVGYSFFAKTNAQGQLVPPLYFPVEGTVEVTKVDGKLKVEVNGLNSNNVPVHVVYDATKAGNDTPDQGLTLTATGLETQLESDGSYTLQGNAVVNGDESNLMDFMLCVYPTDGYTDAFLNGWSVMIFGAPTPGAFVENEDGTFTYTAQIEDTYGDGTIYNINMSGTIKKTEGPEYTELEDQITNMTFDLENMVIYGGPSTNFEIEVVLGLGEDNFDGSFTLSDESSVAIRGIDAEFVEGYVYDIDINAPSATAVVKVNWDGMYYAFTLTMTAAPAEATKVVVENATVEVEKYLLFGDTYDYSLKMTGNWTNEADGITYPVLVEVPVYYPEATEPFSILSTVTVGGMGDNDPWLGFGEGELTVTTVDGVVTATGVVSDWSGLVIDITISGKLPQDPGPGTGIEDVEVEVKAVKVIKNGQLIISKDGKEYNAQGATVK